MAYCICRTLILRESTEQSSMHGVEPTGKTEPTTSRENFEMAVTLQDVIERINQADDPNKRNQPLPDDATIKKYEEATGFHFSEDYKVFLKSVSNSFVGFVSPFTLNQSLSESYGDLVFGIKEVKKIGVQEDWLPICEDNGDYYCIAPDGSVRFWSHNGFSGEVWPDLATWANEVWLNGL
jgi:hypothetical protein